MSSLQSKMDQYAIENWETRLKGVLYEIDNVQERLRKFIVPATKGGAPTVRFPLILDDLYRNESGADSLRRLIPNPSPNVNFDELSKIIYGSDFVGAGNIINNSKLGVQLLETKDFNDSEIATINAALRPTPGSDESQNDSEPMQDVVDGIRLTALNHLHIVLDELRYFLEDRHTFFLNGFYPLARDQKEDEDSTRITLIQSPEFPPPVILRNVLSRASFDLAVIQRGFVQRTDETMKERLDQADKLANISLSLVHNNSNVVIRKVKPITYFQRDTTVRLVPYAPYFFIGIPYTSIYNDFDLLAIPHEVAHHVYNQGIVMGRSIKSFIESSFYSDIQFLEHDWILNWLEEIFADIYSVLVAGPIAALSMQEIILDNEASSLSIDDGEHPVGKIRPYVHAKALLTFYETSEIPRKARKYRRFAKLILARWEMSLKQLHIDPNNYLFHQNASSRKWVNIARTDLDHILDTAIQKMVDLVTDMGFVDRERLKNPWLSIDKSGARGRKAPNNGDDSPKYVSLEELDDAMGRAENDQDPTVEAIDGHEKRAASRRNTDSSRNYRPFLGIVEDEVANFKIESVLEDEFNREFKEDLPFEQNQVASLPNIFDPLHAPYSPMKWLPYYRADGWIDRGTQGSTRPVSGPENVHRR